MSDLTEFIGIASTEFKDTRHHCCECGVYLETPVRWFQVWIERGHWEGADRSRPLCFDCWVRLRRERGYPDYFPKSPTIADLRQGNQDE